MLYYTSRLKRYTNRKKLWDLSSAGRASALQAEGHRFEPCRSHFKSNNCHYGEIAQLARARGSYPRCRGFESPSRYATRRNPSGFLFLLRSERGILYLIKLWVSRGIEGRAWSSGPHGCEPTEPAGETRIPSVTTSTIE